VGGMSEFTVTFDGDALRDLAIIQDHLGGSLEDALSHAIGMEAVLVEQAALGEKVLLLSPNGTTREVPVFFSRHKATDTS
jgi:hypothetical protein